MAVTWNIVSLDSTKTVGSLSDVVTTVHWTASDSETVGEDTYTGNSYGSVGLAEADPSSFTAYGSITEADAIAWAKAALGSDEVTEIEAGITAQITEAKTPTTTSGVPW
tara:strand:+ start:195 stop:521 length:327 start_codon:yes stop_codon:yes gene_type:complete